MPAATVDDETHPYTGAYKQRETIPMDTAGTTDSGTIMVPLRQIAPHPANFRTTLTDLSELATSIIRGGLSEPPTVMPANRVARAWPRYAEQLAGYAWVLLWGHRRLAAAQQAFANNPQAMIPVVTRRDSVCDDPRAQLDLITKNALAHRAWNPIEEARALQASLAAGRNQTETAELFGCHQSHVSGRLALLRLPSEITEAVETGRLGVADARKLARLENQDDMQAVWRIYLNHREDAWITSIDQAIAEHADRTAYQNRRRQALARAEAAGLRVVDPVEEFGRDISIHRLTNPEEVEEARAAGSLVAAISADGNLEHYTSSPVSRVGMQPRGPAPDQRRAAAAARERAGRLLAANPPAIPTDAAHIVDAFLHSAPLGWRPIAQRWLRWLRLGPTNETESLRWWEQIYAADWETRVWAAYCLTLAEQEYLARTRTEWNETNLAWLRRLITEAGYLPRRWEQHRLTDTDGGGGSERAD